MLTAAARMRCSTARCCALTPGVNEPQSRRALEYCQSDTAGVCGAQVTRRLCGLTGVVAAREERGQRTCRPACVSADVGTGCSSTRRCRSCTRSATCRVPRRRRARCRTRSAAATSRRAVARRPSMPRRPRGSRGPRRFPAPTPGSSTRSSSGKPRPAPGLRSKQGGISTTSDPAPLI